MKYFTLNELCSSATARRKGIDNTPGKVEKENLISLVDHILDPLREVWKAPIIVTSGYRCKRLNSIVGGAKSSQHCFDEQTEILTESGWKNYMTISEDDMVYSYNVAKDKIELTPIDSIIIRNHRGKMLKIKNTCIDVMVTDKHRMLVRYPFHKYKRKGGKNISPEGQAYFDSLKTDNDKYHFELAEDVYGKRRIYKCSSNFDGEKSANITLLKFCMAFVCDGYWCIKHKSHAMGFRFKKERKITHLQELANALGWSYTINVDKHGVTIFYFCKQYGEIIYDIVGRGKILPNHLISLSIADKKTLLECYATYDGYYDKRDELQRFSISTSVKRNADVLQAMAVTSGIKCSMRETESHVYDIKGHRGIAKPSFALLTCQKKEVRANEECYEWVDYDGTVWCANNRNTTLITRRNGNVSIQGNCIGQAADIRAVSDKPEDNKRLRDLIVSLNLPYDQLIDEYGCDWIHVSYRPNGRRQKLSAVRYGGKTIYKQGFI